MRSTISRRQANCWLLAAFLAAAVLGNAQARAADFATPGITPQVGGAVPYDVLGQALLTASLRGEAQSWAANAEAAESLAPTTLDIAKFYRPLPASFPRDILKSFLGRQVIDGIPFDAGGQAFLWGQAIAERREMDLPNAFEGIAVGRTFDELHLIHHTRWLDVEGQIVARVSLNYADGSKYITPLRYGVHVRNWYRLPSEEVAATSDPDTKVCWRHAAVQVKAPIRLYKTTLTNPMPKKGVTSIDIISGRGLASYTLIAATVTNGSSVSEAPRQFNGRMTVRIVDSTTGKPIENALVEPGMNVEDENVVALPFRTSASGEGTIRYPTAATASIYVNVKRDGYSGRTMSWNESDGIPAAITIRLVPYMPTSRRYTPPPQSSAPSPASQYGAPAYAPSQYPNSYAQPPQSYSPPPATYSPGPSSSYTPSSSGAYAPGPSTGYSAPPSAGYAPAQPNGYSSPSAPTIDPYAPAGSPASNR